MAHVMRVRLGGGVPEPVMDVPRLNNYACPRHPRTLFHGASTEDGKKLIFSAFDPLTGKARQVLTLDIHRGGTP